jgi:hypothetical protein
MTSKSNENTSDRESQLFNSAVLLWQQEDKQQEAVDLLFELAQEGHVDSIKELFYIFLSQGDTDEAATVLNLEGADPAHSTLIYLHAELLEAQGNFDPSAFARAAEAGSAMAAFRLVNHFVLTDRSEAKYWFVKAKKIGHRFLDQYQELIDVYPEDRSFIIVCGSDESNTDLEVRVFSKKSQVLLEKFDDLEDAVSFCIEKKLGFEVRYVGDEWPNISELAEDNSYSTYCRVIPDRDLIVIWRDSDLVWSGSSEEIDEAIEYLIENADQWWQLNYCDFVRQFEEENEGDQATSRESQTRILPNTRKTFDSKLAPRIPGFRSSLVSFEENEGDGFLNINYEASFEGLWFPCDINEPDKCLKGVIHLALTLGYGQAGYGTLEGKSSSLYANFPHSAAGWQDSNLLDWLDSISSEQDTDTAFTDALIFLTEDAWEADPGWTFILNGKGLRMSSVWTEDSDIWGEREFREELPLVDIQKMRHLWFFGVLGEDTSFKDLRQLEYENAVLFQHSIGSLDLKEDDDAENTGSEHRIGDSPEIVAEPNWGSFRMFWTDCELTITPNLSGFIDIEGGSVGISGKWLDTCSSCYSKISCSVCGRNSTNNFQLRAGNGDGIYSVFEISFDEKAVGAFLILDEFGYAPAIMARIASTNEVKDDDPDALAAFYKEFYKDFYKSIGEFDQSLPMHYLGDIRVDENPIYMKGDDPAGILIFGEAGEGKDSIHSLVTLNNIVPGNYRSFVFAHRNEENENILVPRFVLMLEENSANQIGLTEDFANAINLKDEYERWSKSTVFARIGEKLAPYVISGNVDWCNLRFARELKVEDYETARNVRMEWLSWLLMLQAYFPSKETQELILDSARELDLSTSILLKARGQFNHELFDE